MLSDEEKRTVMKEEGRAHFCRNMKVSVVEIIILMYASLIDQKYDLI